MRAPSWLAGVCWVLATGAAQAVPSFEAVRAAHAPSDVPLLDRHGVPLQTVRIDNSVRRGPWVPLDQVSPALRVAIVLGEDRRYWDHGGVDWRALAASAWANAWNTRTRGASTLTMQLAGLSDAELARPAGGRSVASKLTQMHRAQQFEAAWSKAQILEAYLNRVPLRGELAGVAAAANVLFGKHASGLDAVEAALLAAMVRAPNAAAPAIERRACEVLRLQQQPCDGLATTLAVALARRPGALLGSSGEVLAPHLAAHMVAHMAAHTAAHTAARLAASVPPFGTGAAAPQALHTSLDANIQRVALRALRRQLAELRGREVEDGAVLVLDNTSGEVLAWVGSSGTLSSAAAVDAVLARRQPGSTLKPFVYALALQQRLITAASRLDDSPLQLAAGAGLYQPQNYDHAYKGWVSARTALASSLNVPAVRLAAMLGPEALYEGLNRHGLRISESGGYHGLALALGSAEVSLLDLSNAYRTLANGGRHSAPRWQPLNGKAAVAVAPAALSVAPPAASPSASPSASSAQALSPAVAHVVSDMLADPSARALTFGLDSPLVTRGWAAVKTGTSKDLRDNWCIGYSSRYTVGVWVGNASGAPMHGVSGISGAAPVWRELMLHLHADAPSRAPAAPPGLVQREGEWYLVGTEPALRPVRALQGAAQSFGISSPREGSVVLLDPDIPMAAQRLVFEGAAGRWRLDGRDLGQGTQLSWLPRPGAHVLERRALDAGAEGPVDRIRFEVRAAPAPRKTRTAQR